MEVVVTPVQACKDELLGEADVLSQREAHGYEPPAHVLGAFLCSVGVECQFEGDLWHLPDSSVVPGNLGAFAIEELYPYHHVQDKDGQSGVPWVRSKLHRWKVHLGRDIYLPIRGQK